MEFICNRFTGKHRQSEETRTLSERMMASSSQAPPSSMRLTSKSGVKNYCNSVCHNNTGIYVGMLGGIDLLTPYGQQSCVILAGYDV